MLGPETMKAIINEALLPDGGGLKLTTIERPTPRPGELLLRVRVSTVAPADHMLTEGTYYFQRDAPFVPGLSAVGEVVAHDAGLYGRYLLGKRVFFSPGYDRDGTWSEFAIADAKTVVPLGDLEDEVAVSLANALTAEGLVQTARELGSKAVVINAAAGNLAGLIAARAPTVGLGVVAVVRKSSQVTELRAAGMRHVLNQTDDDFATQLESLTERLGATVLIDSLGGGASVAMMNAMPRGSTVLVIGHLARQPLSFEALPLLLGRNQTLRAFGVAEWMDGQSLFGVLRTARNAQQILRDSSRLAVKNRHSLEELVAQFSASIRDTSGGRTLVFPNGIPG